jgi:hypothetical protein
LPLRNQEKVQFGVTCGQQQTSGTLYILRYDSVLVVKLALFESELFVAVGVKNLAEMVRLDRVGRKMWGKLLLH